jgi:hypothetical protein
VEISFFDIVDVVGIIYKSTDYCADDTLGD